MDREKGNGLAKKLTEKTFVCIFRRQSVDGFSAPGNDFRERESKRQGKEEDDDRVVVLPMYHLPIRLS